MTARELTKHVKEIRLSQGLSRDKLAKSASFCKQNIEKIENGKREPKLSTYLKLLHALGYDLAIVDYDNKR